MSINTISDFFEDRDRRITRALSRMRQTGCGYEAPISRAEAVKVITAYIDFMRAELDLIIALINIINKLR